MGGPRRRGSPVPVQGPHGGARRCQRLRARRHGLPPQLRPQRARLRLLHPRRWIHPQLRPHVPPRPHSRRLRRRVLPPSPRVPTFFELVLDPVSTTLDRAFLEKKQELYKKVFPDFFVLGWYSTGSDVQDTDMLIHKAAAALGDLFEDKPQSANDAWRKLHPDPLLLIRQREQDANARIKNNPIKMAEIKKSAVVLCLVDTYLKLGPAFLPYLERLDSAQLQLVTTYANRLSQTRFIAVDV